MKLLKLVIAAAIAVGASLCTQGQQSSPAPDSALNYRVTVHYGTNNLTAPRTLAQQLESDVVQMIRSANYNSAIASKGVWQHPEPVSEITQHYRELLAHGNYVLVKWTQPKKLQTILGDFAAVEAIVELERPGVWMCAFDPEGRLIHLGKFRGDLLANMEKAVRQFAN